MTTRDQLLLGAGALALVAAAAGAWLLIAEPQVGGTLPPSAVAALVSGTAAPSAARSASAEPLVIDVEGGVQRPGIVRLAGGARVADAIKAAGGYAASADLAAAAAKLNLAAPLKDGQQVYVPVAGAAAAGGANGSPAAGAGSPGGDGSGLVDLNQATPEELDALPGIGPVTVQKIVAARQERPFSSLDEAVERKVLSSSQLDKIRDLVTVG